jgi:protein-tyrosine phosphatase
MIDMHCHILPGIDDGPGMMLESLSMARQAVADGIHTIVATPHALGGTYPNSPAKIIRETELLQIALKAENIDLKLYSGCEVHNCLNMAARIKAGEATFLNQVKKHILVEFPFELVSKEFIQELSKVVDSGITPVLGHPERSKKTYHNPMVLYDLITMGCLVQINSTSINGGFGPEILECAKNLLIHRMVHIVGSDAHSAGYRAPLLSLAVKNCGETLGNQSEALKMVLDRPQQILEGQTVEIPEPEKPKNSKWFSFFK